MKLGRCVVAVGLLTAGCANARLAREPGALGDTPAAQRVATAAGPIPIFLYTRQLKFDKPTDGFIGPHWWKRSATKQLDRVLHDFPSMRVAQRPRGSDPKTEPDAQSLHLVIEATQATAGSKGWSKVSSMTKYIIPSKESTAVELEARLMQGDTIVKTYETSATYETKKHLLILLAPWMWKLGVPGAVAQDALRELCSRVQQETQP